MRRVLALLGGVAIATAAFTGSALAARPDRITDTVTVVFCDLTNEAGTVIAEAGQSAQFGSFGFLDFWAAPATPEFGPPTWTSASSAVVVEGLSVSAAYELVEFIEPPNPEDPPFGEPVGEATLEATLTPVGEPTPYSFEDQHGNRKIRVEGVVQEYSVAGTLSLPEDITYDLSTCNALTDTFTLFQTNPAATVFHSERMLQLSCFWETADGFVNLNAFADPDFGTFADLFMSDATGEYQGTGEAVLTTEAFSTSMDLFPAFGGSEDPVGSAIATAELTPTNERVNDRFTFDNVKVHVTGQVFAVEGTLELTTPAGTQTLAMDEVSCFAGELRFTEHQSARQGPKARPLPNDAPEGAEPLAIGDSLAVRTGGTALEPEAPCMIEEGVELPFGHTAWWTFEGTGGPVTIDTSGSDFDTALAIYADEGGQLVQVACVDDVASSLQAVVTIDTVAGVTYYIQAGGFDGSSGRLVLSLS
jgi:hypothetical protein